MSRKLFGTDGIRGVANDVLTPEFAFSIGAAAGRLPDLQTGPNCVAIGRDTRRSGPMLESALAAGFCSVGVSVERLGVVPTGLISRAAMRPGIGLGVVVSASHNPAPDNGIKLIGPDGRKLPDLVERWVEETMEAAPERRPLGADVGTVDDAPERVIEEYMDVLEAIVPERLVGMMIAVDGSNGAAYSLGPKMLERLGAVVVAVGVAPDGMNINSHCGATHPKTIQDLTVTSKSDVGVAFDGDADRAVFSDNRGRLINGDRTMAMWCAHWKVQPPVVVGTVMSNSGLERYMASKGIALERAAVGDKHVAQRMRETNAKIGGEQSGHIIFSERGVTGDGLITALEMFRVLKREGRPSSSFVDDFEPIPQILVNVQLPNKDAWQDSSRLQSAIAEAEELIGETGRLNIRPSGTQPMLRIMVEAESFAARDQAASAIVGILQSELGGTIYSQVDLTHALGD